MFSPLRRMLKQDVSWLYVLVGYIYSLLAGFLAFLSPAESQGFIFWLQRWKNWPSSADKVQGLSSDLRLPVQWGRYSTKGSATVTNTRNQPLLKEKFPFYLYQKRGRPKGKQVLIFSKNGYKVISSSQRCSFRTFVLPRVGLDSPLSM